ARNVHVADGRIVEVDVDGFAGIAEDGQVGDFETVDGGRADAEIGERGVGDIDLDAVASVVADGAGASNRDGARRDAVKRDVHAIGSVAVNRAAYADHRGVGRIDVGIHSARCIVVEDGVAGGQNDHLSGVVR